jgi:hypothetical protein
MRLCRGGCDAGFCLCCCALYRPGVGFFTARPKGSSTASQPSGMHLYNLAFEQPTIPTILLCVARGYPSLRQISIPHLSTFATFASTFALIFADQQLSPLLPSLGLVHAILCVAKGVGVLPFARTRSSFQPSLHSSAFALIFALISGSHCCSAFAELGRTLCLR